MVDYTDDWMESSRNSIVWEHKKPENKMLYYIERQRRVICFGNPGSITEWDQWGLSFDTAEARDKEYEKLRKEYPVWSLRKTQKNPYLESITRRCS